MKQRPAGRTCVCRRCSSTLPRQVHRLAPTALLLTLPRRVLTAVGVVRMRGLHSCFANNARDADVLEVWTLSGRGLAGRHVSALMSEPDAGGVFAATHGHGIYASTDFGDTRSPASQGLTVSNVFSLSCTGGTGAVSLLAGTPPGLNHRRRGVIQMNPSRFNFVTLALIVAVRARAVSQAAPRR